MRRTVAALARAAVVLAVVAAVSCATALRVSVVSDINLDLDYGTPKAEGKCVSPPALIYGQAGCDSPVELIFSCAQDAAKQQPQFTLFTGDFQRHDMNKGDIPAFSAFTTACTSLSGISPKTQAGSPSFVGAIGNSDVIPESTFNYKATSHPSLISQANILKTHGMLSDSAQQTMSKCGFYSQMARDNLRVVVLHTLLWSTIITPPVPTTELDPCGQFNFLAQELHSAKEAKQKVIIIGHMPPSLDTRKVVATGHFTSDSADMLWKQQYQSKYASIVSEFKDVIVTQMFGYTHQFAIVADSALGVPMYMINSVSPMTGSTPAYMLAEFDDKTAQLTKLQQRTMNDMTKGSWTAGQDVATALKLSSLVNVDIMRKQLQGLLTDDISWGMYQTLQNGGGATKSCDDKFCRAVSVCSMTSTNYNDIKACVAAAAPTQQIQTEQPLFHVRPPTQWINDPNGPYRDPKTGKIHLYMQYNPFGPLWGNMSWYHVTSEDYVKWVRPQESVAMTNDTWYDKGGVFSGTVVENEMGVPVAVYTCTEEGNKQRQCLALPTQSDVRGKRDFNKFVKSPLNPILTEDDVPGLVELGNFRDPTEWWPDPKNASRWLIAFSARVKDADGDNGHVVVFSTDDPTYQSGYKFSHSLYMYKYDPDRMFECPDFFTLLDNKKASPTDAHFLKVSTMPSHRDYIVYGDYKEDKSGNYVFAPDAKRGFTFLDFGPMYASKTFYDPILKRRMLWGWTNEELSDDQIKVQGWSGVMNMPRLVEYDEAAKKLKTGPVPELKGLRKAKVFDSKAIAAKAQPAVVVPSGKTTTRYHEIVAKFHIDASLFESAKHYTADKAPEFGVIIRADDKLNKMSTISVRMPAASVEPVSGKAYNEQDSVMKTIPVVDASNPAAFCSSECAADRTCMTWTYKSKPSPTCTMHWRLSKLEDNADAQSGVVNEPQLVFGRAQSGTMGGNYELLGRAPLTQTHPNEVELHIFVDDSVVEVFKDGGLEALTGRLYLPQDDAQTGIAVYAKNMDDVSVDVAVYTMDTLWAPTPGPSAVDNFTKSLHDLLNKIAE